MKKPIGIVLTSLLAAGLLAGCNSNNGSNNGGFGTNCGNPPPGFQVLYPQPGASRVSPAKAIGVWVAAKPPLAAGNSYNFFAVQSSGNQQYTSQFATTNQIPNPHASPAPGATVYVSYFPQPVGPLQGVNLYWNDGGTGCTPNVVVSSFSTGQ